MSSSKTKYNRTTLFDILLNLCTGGFWSIREYWRTNKH